MSSLVAEKRYKSAKTAVFWDMEDCPIPDGLNAVEVSRNIRKALKKLNYEAKASIYAYGDTDQIKAGLNSTGYVVKQHPDAGDEDDDIAKREIDYRGTAAIYADETNQIQDEDLDIVVNHTPRGEGEAKLFKIITDALIWAVDSVPFANLMIIVGRSITQQFEKAIFHLYMMNYKVLLVQPRNLPGNTSASSDEEKLLWEDLSAGNYSYHR